MWCRGKASVNLTGGDFRCTERHPYYDKNHHVNQRFRFAVLSRCRKGDFTPFCHIYNDERRLFCETYSLWKPRRICVCHLYVATSSNGQSLVVEPALPT
ncbi:Otogelin [Frankliniella fusca]|uniref:Otogelin n=1 Tax=Frankliniella fusca TaxID=407009 RepID=A0AAE1I182_9NEOP|nr:Otogelin [Frankliniella fusca]